MRKVKSSGKSSCFLPCTDGFHSTPDICKVFSSKFLSVLHPCDASTNKELFDSVSADISVEELNVLKVSEDIICEAFTHLKLSKSDGSILVSGHLIHAIPAISLPYLATSILRHSFMPTLLRVCILVPIPNGDKDRTKSDKYRGIALAPTLSKLLEWSLLLKYPSEFSTSELQFGFKTGMSTNNGTGLLKSFISRYMNAKSNVFACFLDASKAFDWVNHSILFSRLLDRGLFPFIVCLLLGWY